jgi:hypothetical protein
MAATSEYTTIAGVTVPTSTVPQALGVLRGAPGVMIRQPLRRAGNPLAAMDYHAIAAAERELYPELMLAAGTHRVPTPHEKTAVMHYLERVLAS